MAGTAIDLDRLKDPFPAEDVEWRVQQCGQKSDGTVWCKVLAYLTNRAIMDRLDAVCGPANWKNEFTAGPGGGVLCGISIRIGDEWLTKWDGADNTHVEAVKGGLSDSMKRAAVQFGIGRYLYHLGESWAETSKDRKQGWTFASSEDKKTKQRFQFYWSPPALPQWALPANGKQPPAKTAPPPQKNQPGPHVRELAKVLRTQIGCKSKTDADTVLMWCTNREYDAERANATEQDAANALTLIQEKLGAAALEPDRLLATAKLEMEAEGVF